MLDRRNFTFGMLLGLGTAAAGTAHAGSPAYQTAAQTLIPEASPEAAMPPLSVRYVVAQQGKTLEVRMFLTNTSSEPVSFVMKRGSRPGPWLVAQRVGAPEGEQLAEIIELDRKELISRIGPRPQYQALAAGSETEVGVYRFETPEGRVGQVVLTATVDLASFESVTLPPQVLKVRDGKTGV